jgi:hypothetical protein
MNYKKHYHVYHLDDYQLIEFNKNDNELIKNIKKYGHRNCKKEIEKYWIISSLENCDKGFSYFNTEIIETKDEKGNIIKMNKYRPCAYLCLEKYDKEHINLSLVCSLTSTSHLGTKLINEAFNYSINNGYKIMSLDSITDKTTNYYLKKGFEIKEKIIKKIGDRTKYMIKKF